MRWSLRKQKNTCREKNRNSLATTNWADIWKKIIKEAGRRALSPRFLKHAAERTVQLIIDACMFSMFKVTHNRLESLMPSTFIRRRLCGHASKIHQLNFYTHRRQNAFSVRVIPFWNKMQAEIDNASSVKSFKILQDPAYLTQLGYSYSPTIHITPIDSLK